MKNPGQASGIFFNGFQSDGRSFNGERRMVTAAGSFLISSRVVKPKGYPQRNPEPTEIRLYELPDT